MRNTEKETKEAPVESPPKREKSPGRKNDPLKIPKKLPGKKPNPKA
jgi:hypothetical protein